MSAELADQELETIHEILTDLLHVAREQLTPDARITDDLQADSLDVVEIGMRLEEAFDITLPDDDLDPALTVAGLEELVARRLRGRTRG